MSEILSHMLRNTKMAAAFTALTDHGIGPNLIVFEDPPKFIWHTEATSPDAALHEPTASLATLTRKDDNYILTVGAIALVERILAHAINYIVAAMQPTLEHRFATASMEFGWQKLEWFTSHKEAIAARLALNAQGHDARTTAFVPGMMPFTGITLAPIKGTVKLIPNPPRN